MKTKTVRVTDILWERSEQHYQKQNWEQARSCLEKLIPFLVESDELYIEAVIMLSGVYVVQKEWEKARKLLQAARACCPQDIDLQTRLADALYLNPDAPSKQIDQAMTLYRKVTRLDPNSAAGFLDYGMALFQEGQYGEAIKPLSEARELQIDLFESWYFLALSYAETGQGEKARSLASQARFHFGMQHTGSRELTMEVGYTLARFKQTQQQPPVEAPTLPMLRLVHSPHSRNVKAQSEGRQRLRN